MNEQQIETILEHDHAHNHGVEAPGLDHEDDHSTEALGFDHEHDYDHVHEDETALRDIPITARNLPRLAGLGLIRLYQMTFSKTLPSGTCRFYPTCSHYGYQAIVKHGLVRGSGLAIWRVARCQPFSKGGYDPVP